MQPHDLSQRARLMLKQFSNKGGCRARDVLFEQVFLVAFAGWDGVDRIEAEKELRDLGFSVREENGRLALTGQGAEFLSVHGDAL